MSIVCECIFTHTRTFCVVKRLRKKKTNPELTDTPLKRFLTRSHFRRHFLLNLPLRYQPKAPYSRRQFLHMFYKWVQCTKKCVKSRLSNSAESHPVTNPDCMNELITTINFWRTTVITLPLCSPKGYHPYDVQISPWSPSPRARQRVAWSPKRFLARSPEHLWRPKAWKHRWRERLALEDPLHWIAKMSPFSLFV